MPGIGPITASALVATVGDANSISNGRQLGAWLGLVPRQHSTGGKSVLLGISKRGNAYLRTLLIHGARLVLYAAQRRKVSTSSGIGGLLVWRNANIAAVAVVIANKNARIIWAMLAKDRQYEPDHLPVHQGASCS